MWKPILTELLLYIVSALQERGDGSEERQSVSPPVKISQLLFSLAHSLLHITG